MEFEIKPKKKLSFGLNELIEYKELFYFFAWRDIKVKYKQTFLGVLWAIFQPMLMTILFTLGFGKIIASNSSIILPYPIFALSGFMVWNIFSSGLTNAGNSMINNSNIIKKIYFPRLIIPISSILVSLIDFLFAFIVFIPILIHYNVFFNISALYFIPLSIILTCIATFGLGTYLAAVNIKYRDFRYILPFFIQAMFFITPIIFPIKITNNVVFQFIIKLNPLNAPISLFRHSLLKDDNLDFSSLLLSVFVSLLLLIIGLVYFKKTEVYFADLA